MKKKSMKKLAHLLIVVLIVYSTIHAAIILNDEPPPLTDPAEINSSIIDGTSFLLQSTADAFLLMNEVEIAEKYDFNFYYALELTNSAIEKLQQAKARYIEGISFRKQVFYDVNLIQKYRQFDFENFAIDNNLNQAIVSEVSLFLKKGDFRGVFLRAVQKIDEILVTLETIKADIASDVKPDIRHFWNLLQRYNLLGLFGNYATMIFNTV